MSFVPTQEEMAELEKKRKAAEADKAKQPQAPAKNPEPELFKLLREIKEGLTEKENGAVHQQCRIADATERMAKALEKIAQMPTATTTTNLVNEKKTPAPTPTPVPKVPAAPAKPAEKTQVAPQPATQPQAANNKLQEIQGLFTADLQNMLLFEAKTDKDGTFIHIKPRQYLGSDNFAKIASTIRDNGGAYVSAGKESHFRVYYI